jgi:hypothetical protein
MIREHESTFCIRARPPQGYLQAASGAPAGYQQDTLMPPTSHLQATLMLIFDSVKT